MFCRYFPKGKTFNFNSVSKFLNVIYIPVSKHQRYSQILGSYLPKSPVLLPQLDDVNSKCCAHWRIEAVHIVRPDTESFLSIAGTILNLVLASSVLISLLDEKLTTHWKL